MNRQGVRLQTMLAIVFLFQTLYPVLLPAQESGSSSAKEVKSAAATLPATIPSLKLPFFPDQMHLRTDGRTALLVDGNYYDVEESLGRVRTSTENDSHSRVALVDVSVSPPAIIADHVLPFGVSAPAAFDENYVYLASRASDVLYVLSAKDLSNVRRIFAPGRIVKISDTSKTLYIGCKKRDNIGLEIFDRAAFSLPTFTPITLPNFENRVSEMLDRGEIIPVRQGDYWLFDGVIYDSTMSKPIFLLNANVFLGSDRLSPGLVYRRIGFSELPFVGRWGVGLQRDLLLRLDGQKVGQLGGTEVRGPMARSQQLILNDLPLAARATAEIAKVRHEINRGAARYELVDELEANLALFNIVNGDQIKAIPLLKQPKDTSTHRFVDPKAIACAAKETVVVLADRWLFEFRTSGNNAIIDSSKLPVPLHWQYNQTVFSMDAQATQTMTVSASGGTPPYVYSLVSPINGVEIDSKTGEISLKGSLLSQTILDDAIRQLANRFGYAARQGADPADNSPAGIAASHFENELNFYLQLASPLFESLSGHKAHGVPIVIAIKLSVQDDAQRAVEFSPEIILDVPEEMFVQRFHDANLPGRSRTVTDYSRVTGAPIAGVSATSKPAASISPTEAQQLVSHIKELEHANEVLRLRIKELQAALNGSRENTKGSGGSSEARSSTTRP